MSPSLFTKIRGSEKWWTSLYKIVGVCVHLMLTHLQFLEIKLAMWQRNVKVVQEHICMNHKEICSCSYGDGFKIDHCEIAFIACYSLAWKPDHRKERGETCAATYLVTGNYQTMCPHYHKLLSGTAARTYLFIFC